jgi:EAL domain-containing protein (putative c-di-GMP-specific phosphodiesterase class I)
VTARDPNNEPRRFSGPATPAPTRIAVDEALRNNWLEIWYQPKIDLKRKCLAGAEALARIRHPQEGMLWPESFLPGIDEASLHHLTEYALLATLRNWTMFNDAGFNLHLAINVPASALSKLPIVEIVKENRPKSDTWPGLILEVTEDQIVRDIAAAKACADELKGYGVTIAIDDFGAGYSSFASLRDVPFAELKVDGSFVKNCAIDATNAAICQTAIDLAHRGGRRHREPGRSAGACRHGLRLRAGHAGGAADAERAFPGAVAPALEQAGQTGGSRGAFHRSCRRRPRRLTITPQSDRPRRAWRSF